MIALFRRLWAMFRGPPEEPAEFTVFERPDGSKVAVDRATFEYLYSNSPQPTRESWAPILEQTVAARVFRGGVLNGEPGGTEILFETRDGNSIANLCDALKVVNGPAGHCMCFGDPTIEMLDDAGQRLAVIGVHHGTRIRWDAWRDDAALVDGRALLEWLNGHGVAYPLEEFEESLRVARKSEAAWNRWRKATPPCLRQFADRMAGPEGMMRYSPPPDSAEPDSAPVRSESAIAPELRRALEEAYPDVGTRARVLLEWFGNGRGFWSPVPMYELIAEELLLRVPMRDLLAALESGDLSDAHLEGAARLFASGNFRTMRSEDARELPVELKRQLLEHVQQSSDSEKAERASTVFGD